MELRLCLPNRENDWSKGEVWVTVRTESDIRTAGFAAARAVREWLRHMPFVPSSSDLQWGITAAVVPEDKPKPAAAPAAESPRPKRKSKRGK